MQGNKVNNTKDPCRRTKYRANWKTCHGKDPDHFVRCSAVHCNVNWMNAFTRESNSLIKLVVYCRWGPKPLYFWKSSTLPNIFALLNILSNKRVDI